MTYKKIVQEIIRKGCDSYVENLLKKNGIDYKWITAEKPEIDTSDKETFRYDCKVNVQCGYGFMNRVVLTVGGTVDDMLGICYSVVWNDNHKIIWMNVKDTREDLGITKFDLFSKGV